jgi:hypothetical protein
MAITKAQQKTMVAALRAKSGDHAGLVSLCATYVTTTYPGDTLVYDICAEFLKAGQLANSSAAVQAIADNHPLCQPLAVCPTCGGSGRSLA